MTLPPDLVLFDCDGVLVDSERITNALLVENLAARGLQVAPDRVIDLFVGGTIAGVAKTARSFGATLEENWVDLIYAEMFERLAQEATPVPGVPSLLDALDAAGIPYGVCSNGPHAKMDVTLARCGLTQRFAGRIYSREDVPNPKPAPDVYLKAAADAGIAPANCVVVEDSPNGARAGKAAGMHTLGFIADTAAEHLTPICDAVFDDMRALPGLLGLTSK
ncbi:HAD family phosphatase [Shimia sp. R10_1]|uniref:HAD family hydrolase n=1 Tax=Shimia sp. R10_1 TaxID=2821095 RepID=UPI001ADBE437|nr:HAD family phosphatase [Shimia sp. R10_1]MBO9473968.1 HAD family phosphatase [Shimia sp. R10_1]